MTKHAASSSACAVRTTPPPRRPCLAGGMAALAPQPLPACALPIKKRRGGALRQFQKLILFLERKSIQKEL